MENEWNQKTDKHTFAVCAYKDSRYLEDCLQSLYKQTIKSEIIIVTSTPSLYIDGIAEKYNISVYVNEGEGGIVQDWNFAYSKAQTPYVTIAHQDDIYYPFYTQQMLHYLNNQKNNLIYFTNYIEIRDGKRVVTNRLLAVKRLMLMPLKSPWLWKSRFVRRRILSFGCPICCPAVTFVRENLPETIFKVGFKSDEDWEAWEHLSKRKGRFVYNPRILVGHRIHKESATSAILSAKARSREDYTMFCRFWPKWFARWLTKIYSQSERSNEL